jgi:hypothetical protein
VLARELGRTISRSSRITPLIHEQRQGCWWQQPSARPNAAINDPPPASTRAGIAIYKYLRHVVTLGLPDGSVCRLVAQRLQRKRTTPILRKSFIPPHRAYQSLPFTTTPKNRQSRQFRPVQPPLPSSNQQSAIPRTPPLRRKANDERPIPAEMLAPSVTARIEKSDHVARAWIKAKKK